MSCSGCAASAASFRSQSFAAHGPRHLELELRYDECNGDRVRRHTAAEVLRRIDDCNAASLNKHANGAPEAMTQSRLRHPKQDLT
jgi:hypothetical protein